MKTDGLRELQREFRRLRGENAKLPKRQEFPRWQRQAVRNLRRGWGLPPRRRTRPAARAVGRPGRKGDTLQQLMLRGRRGGVPGYLLIPQTFSGEPMPAALCIHGNVPGAAAEVAGEDQHRTVREALEVYHDDYARRLAQRGVVCLVIDQPLQGDRRPAGAGAAAAAAFEAGVLGMLAIGEPYLGQCLADQQLALDYLLTRPEVDRRRVGVIGFSMGGTLAAALGAVDSRLKGVLFSGYVTSWLERLAVGNRPQSTIAYCPGHQWFDMPDILAMAVPKPLIVVAEARGSDADEGRWLRPVRNAYRQTDAVGQLSIWRPPVGPHRFHPEPALDWFADGLPRER